MVPGMFHQFSTAQEVHAEASMDELITGRLARGREDGLRHKPIGEVVAAMGRSFVESPYKAHTLEEPGEEHLVVNVREFDCVTFFESSLALARTIVAGGSTAAEFEVQLRFIRYRGGIIDGYPSRLHYFTDWVLDNAQKNVLTDVTRSIGGRRDSRVLNFMSTHREAYAQLARDEFYARIMETEKRLTGTERFFIPKKQVSAILGKIRTGDIIGITTSLAGLDCSHTGLAVEERGAMKFLHAPLAGGRVQFSSGSLAEYLEGHAKHTGIIVARPLNSASP